jgi:hypothetical protein
MDSPAMDFRYQQMDKGFQPLDGVLVLFFCFLIGVIFALARPHCKTEKIKAWIIMLLSSSTLSFFGCVTVLGEMRVHGLHWTGAVLYQNDDFLSRTVTLFFTASNIMDLVIGFFFYAPHMDPLSTTTHHICYLVLVYILLDEHYCVGFNMCFFMEIPTFILAVGSVFPNCRSDVLFGVSFVIARLGFNIFLSYSLYYASLPGEGVYVYPNAAFIFWVSMPILALHCFWWYKWSSSYSSKVTKRKQSQSKNT